MLVGFFNANFAIKINSHIYVLGQIVDTSIYIMNENKFPIIFIRRK